uniref:Uncharacterized protein n=1 Tax=Vespula pensylvanica TaxID=30213 RepID=A0A834P771_VESPE|nr:hypothetical protein H0235_006214 [Vespula pensylvanica]
MAWRVGTYSIPGVPRVKRGERDCEKKTWMKNDNDDDDDDDDDNDNDENEDEDEDDDDDDNDGFFFGRRSRRTRENYFFRQRRSLAFDKNPHRCFSITRFETDEDDTRK